ncbi:MAG TPA: ribonuclease P protein component [Candidatus Paceibacterota bacterium]
MRAKFSKGPKLALRILVPKAIYKKAVDRNLLKRRIREATRMWYDKLPVGSYTIYCEPGLLRLKFNDIKHLLHNSLRTFL